MTRPHLAASGGPRIDWKTERERIDLAAVATSLLGPAPGRRGERGRVPVHSTAEATPPPLARLDTERGVPVGVEGAGPPQPAAMLPATAGGRAK